MAQTPVDIGTAANFAILTKTGISTVPTSIITGDIGVSPSTGSFITGFSLAADPSGTYWTSTQVSGKCYASDDTEPTPAMLSTAVSDMEAAYTSARGQTAGVTSSVGTISGMTFTAGVYHWATLLYWATDITITGSSTDLFIFQCNELRAGAGTTVILEADETGGTPQAYNIFWAVSGRVSALAGDMRCAEIALLLSSNLSLNPLEMKAIAANY